MGKVLEFWKEELIPEVHDIDEEAGIYLDRLTMLYEKYGEMNVRDIRVTRFTPAYTLDQAFRWDSTPFEFEFEFWVGVDAELDRRGVYGDQ
ncbi:hypothetical protein vBAbaPP1_09 [Acinetobacter phage vB_AbaM_P1]|nr:hypothetical protein vBAbaPP1_09 [Acinetobacter phage vB_AbaM_P1]WAX22668.1 hypothetical protein [Acinetobacter phage vB_AbaP_HB01]